LPARDGIKPTITMTNNNSKTIYQSLGRAPVHPFPARMAPGIAIDVLSHTPKGHRVLDPMAGSGTVLALARSFGHYAVGVDIDPLAVLISKVWTTSLNTGVTVSQAREVLGEAKALYKSTNSESAFPPCSDEETRKFMNYWFDDTSRRQLAALATAIDRVQQATIRDALWCAFSRLIITKKAGASLAMDLSHSRPHRAYTEAPIVPFEKFQSAVLKVIENCIDYRAPSRGPATRVLEGDARKLPVHSESIDLALTSPPYLNAIDYVRCSKFTLVWMGYTVSELRQLRSNSVGTEVGKYDTENDTQIIGVMDDLKLRPALDSRQTALVSRYIDDMRGAMSEVSRVLAPSGRAIYVVGENTIRGTYVRNSIIISSVAEIFGLVLQSKHERTLPANRRYLPPPAKSGKNESMDARMRKEVVLEFKKSSVNSTIPSFQYRAFPS